MKSKLTPYLGLDAKGDMRIHLSAFPLNTPSPMHERGKPLPDIAHRELKGNECLDALQVLTSYYNKEETRAKK
jgi:hypothetical protein